MHTPKRMLGQHLQALWIFPAVVLTEEPISQQGKDKPKPAIHLTLTTVESPATATRGKMFPVVVHLASQRLAQSAASACKMS